MVQSVELWSHLHRDTDQKAALSSSFNRFVPRDYFKVFTRELATAQYATCFEEEMNKLSSYIPEGVPSTLRKLLNSCFCLNAEDRPTFDTICSSLETM